MSNYALNLEERELVEYYRDASPTDQRMLRAIARQAANAQRANLRLVEAR